MYSHILDHVARMKANMLFQFRGALRLEALLDIIGGQIQEAEDAAYSLLVERYLDTAVGAQLDQYGTILNLPRDSDWSDTRYRALLGARIATIRSNGSGDQILNVLAILTESVPSLIEFYPTCIYLQYPGTLLQDDPGWAQSLPDWIDQASSPGVTQTVVEYSPTLYFGFLEDPGASGFDDGTSLLTAGKLASVL